jgi:hypothetical protein
VVPVGKDVLQQGLSFQAQRGVQRGRQVLRRDIVIAEEIYDEFVLDPDIPEDG